MRFGTVAWCSAGMVILAGLAACASDEAAVTAAPEGAGTSDSRTYDAGQGGATAARSPSAGRDAAGNPGGSSPPADAPTRPASDAKAPYGAMTARPIAEASAFSTLYALSDIHGHYAQLVALLARYGLIAPSPAAPTSVTWVGGTATLVMTGDMIDKGPASLDVIEAMMAMQASARSVGGTVIACLGNHEAEFLSDPTDSKFEGSDRIGGELAAQTPAVDPVAFANGSDPRARWLRGLPFGARVGSFFFAHAGDTGGLTVAQLNTKLSAAFTQGRGFSDPAVLGETSLLESRDWYTDPAVLPRNLAALGVKHIVFGHSPGAFGVRGTIVAPAQYHGGLIKIDTGLGADDSNGAMLRVRHASSNDVVEALLPNGATTPVWKGAT